MPTLELIVDARRGKSGALEFSVAVKGAGKAAVTAGRQTKQLQTRMQKLGITAKKTAGFLGAAFAVGGIVASIRGTISVIASFEEAIALTGAVAGVDRASDAFARLEAQARKMGATTRFSATQAAEGLLFLARAGFDAEDAIASLPATLNLATAGALELGRAADIASNIGSTFAEQFGGAVDATVRSVDVLVATANRANTDVTQLAEAMKFAGPTAAAFGIDMEDAAAALGQLGNFGIQASLAGTGLRGVLAKLSTPTGDLISKLDALGIEYEKVNPEANDLVSIFREFKKAGLSAGGAFNIFGNRGAATAIILSNMADETERLRDELWGADNAAQDITDTLNNTLVGAFLSLKSAVQEVILQMGDGGLGGALRSIVDFSTDVVRAMGGITIEGEKIGVMARIVAVEIKALVLALGVFAGVKIIAGVGLLALKLLKVRDAMFAIQLAFATNPIGLIAIVAATAAFALINLSGRFKEIAVEAEKADSRIIDFIGTAAQMDGISGLINQALSIGDPRLITRAFDQLRTVINTEITSLFSDENIGRPVDLKSLFEHIPEQIRGIISEPIKEDIDLMNSFLSSEIKNIEVQLKAAESNLKGLSLGIGTSSGQESFLNAQQQVIDITREIKILKKESGNVSEIFKLEEALRKAKSVFDDPSVDFSITGGQNEIVEAQQQVVRLKDKITELKEESSKPLVIPAARAVEILEIAMSNLDSKQQDLVKTISDLNEISELSAGSTTSAASAYSQLAQITAGLQMQTAGLTERQQAQAQVMLQVGAIIGNSNIGLMERVRILREFAIAAGEAFDSEAARAKMIEDQESKSSAGTEINAILEAQQREIDIIGQLGDSHIRAAELIRITDLANRAFGKGSIEATAAVDQYVENLDRLAEQSAKIAEQKEAARSLADAFGTAFRDIASGAMTAKDALGNFVKSIIDLMFQKLVIDQLAKAFEDMFSSAGESGGGGGFGGFISGLFGSAKGNVFSGGGSVMGFASGGVPDFVGGGAPAAIFPMSGGGIGVAGEAGPEARVGLTRMPNGELGVRSQSGGNQTFNITVMANNPAAFKGSERQMRNSARRALGGGAN